MSWPNEREGMLLSFYGRVGPRTYEPSKVPKEVEALERGGYVTMRYGGSYGNIFVEITDQGRNALGMPPLAPDGSGIIQMIREEIGNGMASSQSPNPPEIPDSSSQEY